MSPSMNLKYFLDELKQEFRQSITMFLNKF